MSMDDEIIKRFREDPVAWVREFFPDSHITPTQEEALRLMASNPRLRFVHTEHGAAIMEVREDIPVEFDELLRSEDGIVGSWDYVPTSTLLDDIKRARELVFSGDPWFDPTEKRRRDIERARVLSMGSMVPEALEELRDDVEGEWMNREPDRSETSRQAFKSITGKHRRRKR